MQGRLIKKKSFTLHLWNEIWKAGNLDKNATYAQNCTFEQLKRRHKIK